MSSPSKQATQPVAERFLGRVSRRSLAAHGRLIHGQVSRHIRRRDSVYGLAVVSLVTALAVALTAQGW